MQIAGNATLAEFSIDILLWKIPLNSHFADAAEAEPQALHRRLAPPVMPPSITSSAPPVQPLPSGTAGMATSFESIGTLRPPDPDSFVQISVSMTTG
jgi:hypothetical protein